MSASETPMGHASGLFRAIVLKEIRERLKVAVACFAIVVVGEFISIGFQKLLASGGFAMGASPSLTLFTLTSALSALLIGRALIVYENRGDRWGFLAHRPVRRSTLFLGKAVAGGLLYLAVTGIPLAFVTMWMATPGHRPLPWDGTMALPEVADLLCGLVYLLAAMLVGMREARWYGSRFVPIGAALVCSGFVIEVSHFWQALAVVAIGILIVGTAAAATIAGGGRYEPLSRWGRATLGLAIVPGLMLAGTFAIGVMTLIAFSHNATRDGARSTDYVIAGDGSVVQRVLSFDGFTRPPQVFAVNDLQGRAVDRYQDSVAREKLTTGVIATPALNLHPNVPGTVESSSNGYRGTNKLFVQLTTSQRVGSALSWYFVRRVGLIAAYNNRSALFMGWMGPDGFSVGDSLPTHRFEGALLRPTSEYAYVQPMLMFPSAVYRVDLSLMGIQKVFSASSGETVLGAATSGDSATMSAYGPRAKFDVISTTTNVYVQGADGAAELSAARASDDSGIVTVSRALLAPGTPTFLRYSSINGQQGTPAEHITEYGERNNVIAQVSIPRNTTPTAESKTSAGDILSASATSVTWQLADGAYRTYRRLNGLPTAVPRKQQQSAMVDWIVPTIASLVAAALTFLLGGLFAFDRNRRLLWTAAGFVLGPLGVALMLSLMDWPVRETCPSCGRERVVTHARCEHCDAPFLPPALDGTEIFEMAAS